MTTWITACEQDQNPYPIHGGEGQIYIGCQSKNLRSIEIEETVPPLDPALLAQAFSAGFGPVLICFFIGRSFGEVINMVRKRRL
ncbi:hypothetical protein UNDYM_2578 [Undibacterium sp. YM2]|uniref:hypothetical protein n=1 Tax=Undibacterium sp. YM2 TaxID=2058625 RepID=UPI001331DEC5|nr:hypothetical protein [Undibacterium sp. YM2]BBB66831.1 hypothetical protein UNDYM_2578 [Undibacterium sp. YM2]